MAALKSFSLLQQQLASGATTCTKITGEYLSAIDANSRFNAFLAVFGEQALRRAKLVDANVAEGRQGPLAGMIVAVKDNVCVSGSATTCASKMLGRFIPPYDATVIRKLEAADAIIIGKTNLDEFAMGSSTENSAYGPVRHPIDKRRVPGGSSGGSAVAVSAGLATAGLGSDTGGSIRQPASFCGIVGVKPTYGRVSRYGLVAFASSFDQIGPLGLRVRDVASILEIIAGHDPNDSTSAAVPVPAYTSCLTGEVRGVRIGLPKEYFSPSLDGEIAEAIMRKVGELRDRGAVVKEVSLPHSAYTIGCYYILTTAEASSNLARYDGVRYGYRASDVTDVNELYARSRSEGFGPEVKRRIMLGTYVLSAGYYDAFYLKAQKVRRLIRNDFDEAFRQVDCLIAPTSPTTAFTRGEKTEDPLKMYLSDIYTVSANLAGVPAMSVPCGIASNGMPIGLQIIGKSFDEEMLFRVGDALESESPRH